MEGLFYGPDGPSEADLRLLGDVRGRRIVELGCGTGANSVLLARSGAVVIGIDPSAEKLAAARRLAEKAGVRLETRQADPASMAFLATDSVDAVLSIYSLGHTSDVQRVFRQVQRVLRPGGPLVLSVAHPARLMLDAMAEDGVPSYFEDSGHSEDGAYAGYPGVRRPGDRHRRLTIEALFGALCRSGHRVDTLLETGPQLDGKGPTGAVPQTLILRARKLGG